MKGKALEMQTAAGEILTKYICVLPQIGAKAGLEGDKQFRMLNYAG